MKKYSFRLETVRRVRKTQEKLAKNQLLIANSEVQSAISAVESRLAEYHAGGDRLQVGAVAVDAFMKRRYFDELSGQAVTAARAAHLAAVSQADMARVAYTDTARKVKALDRLDERSREEYDVEASRAADGEVDEIVTGRFNRSRELSARRITI